MRDQILSTELFNDTEHKETDTNILTVRNSFRQLLGNTHVQAY